MKQVSNDYKNAIIDLGRQYDVKITYGNTTLTNEQLNEVTPHYRADLLKSVMKQLDLDSNVDIPIGTEINCQFGLKVREGSNLLDVSQTKLGYSIDSSTGETTPYPTNSCGENYIPVKPNTAYTFSVNRAIHNIRLSEYKIDKTHIKRTAQSDTNKITITTTANTYYVRWSLNYDNSTTMTQTIVDGLNLMLNEGSTPLPYEPYGAYEYIDYGNYIVYSSEKQEDLLSYRIVCYDKMLYAMKDYEDLELTYPISIKDYISAIATKIGLVFEDEDFTNADKEIPEEKYLDEDGNTLGYTYRDVLDELAQVTASIIKVEDNKLKIMYPDDVIKETSTFENTSGQITTDSKKVLDLEVEGNTYQETTTGKNIFNLNNTTGWQQKVSSTIADQTITLTREVGATNTSYMSFELKLEANTNYYVSGVAKITNIDLTGTIGIYIREDRGSGTVLNSQSLDRTITTNQNIGFSFNSGSRTRAYLWLYVDTNGAETSSTGTRTMAVTNLQVEKGSSATSYEKFTFGASPNPDYPQPIQVVTGNQEINVVGKNLYNVGELTTITSNGITFTPYYEDNKLQYINVNGTATGNVFYNFNKIILPAGSYIITGCTGGSANTYFLGVNFGLGRMSQIDGQYPFTLTEERTMNESFIRVGVGTTVNNVKIYPMIRLSSITDATYEPYIGNIYEVNLGKNLFNINDCYVGSVQQPYMSMDITNNVMTLTAIGTVGAQLARWDKGGFDSSKTYTVSFKAKKVVKGTDGLPKIQFVVYGSNDGSSFSSIVNMNETNPTQGQEYSFNYTFTGYKYYRFYIYNNASTPVTLGEQTQYYDIQFEEGSIVTPYSPYFTPIELCKINDYKDSIKKSEGNNLFDGEIELGGINPDTGALVSNNSRTRSINYTKVKPNTTYYYTRTGGQNRWIVGYKEDKTPITDGTKSSGGVIQKAAVGYLANNVLSGTFTTTATTEYIKWYDTSDTNLNELVMINEGTTPLPYEPYLEKGKWYIEKNIGKVVLDGSESGWSFTNSSGKMIHYRQIVGKIAQKILMYSNYFKYSVNEWQLINNYEFCTQANQYIFIRDDDKTSSTDFKTWLGTHNTIVYYVLATPTYTEITNEELISQLNSIELIDGLNNISITSANLSSPLKISYISEYETITEDYLKDVNVNFSEKFGPVNSLVLSRSADSDLIYRKDDSSIEKNGLTEIKISDNQILNGNDRDEYIDNIFNRLKGIEYYTNDYDSTGITYLELGDFYKVEARGNRYLALMLNDELNVTQGFEELIHTDKPDTSVSDYKKADTTDRRINKATLIVDKQNQTIQALTSRTSNLESKQINDKAELLAKFGDYALDSRVDDITTQVETLQTDTYTKTEVKSILKGTFYDSDNNQIVSEVVKTTSGTFDENGMHYEKTNAKTKSTINEVGVRVDNAINDSELLFAGYDDNINQTIVRTDNLTVRNFLVVGSQSRFQDYEENNEQGTGVFDL